MSIIFNIGFCGDWAGKTWEESGCARDTGVTTCEEYVGGNHAEDFVDVWWGINSVKVYELRSVGMGVDRPFENRMEAGLGRIVEEGEFGYGHGSGDECEGDHGDSGSYSQEGCKF